MAAGSVGTGGKKPPHVKDGIEIEGPGVISWAKPGNSDIRIKGSLSASFIKPRDMGIPRGLVLCAVEANRQIPYSRPLKKGGAIPEMKPHADGSFRFAVRADIMRVLGLPELETTYYVHASCGKYRTGVIAIRVEKGN
jgi:hypothetical protein